LERHVDLQALVLASHIFEVQADSTRSDHAPLQFRSVLTVVRSRLSISAVTERERRARFVPRLQHLHSRDALAIRISERESNPALVVEMAG